MKITRSPASLLGLAMLLWTASVAPAQWQPEVRRARPVDESPVPRALPAEDSIERTLRALQQESSEPPARETERSDQRQLDYANALVTRQLYDLAAAEHQKHLADHQARPVAPHAYFTSGDASA